MPRPELRQCPAFEDVYMWFLGGEMGTEMVAEGIGQINFKSWHKKYLNPHTPPVWDCCIQIQQSFVLNVVGRRFFLFCLSNLTCEDDWTLLMGSWLGSRQKYLIWRMSEQKRTCVSGVLESQSSYFEV